MIWKQNLIPKPIKKCLTFKNSKILVLINRKMQIYRFPHYVSKQIFVVSDTESNPQAVSNLEIKFSIRRKNAS